MTLLTAIRPSERRTLDDAVRAISWSPTGRVLALGADGRALLGGTDRLTAPIGPDPIDCCWITDDRVAVVDGLLGVVIAGGGSVDLVPVERALAVGAPTPRGDEAQGRAHCAVVVGGDGCTVVPPHPTSPDQTTTIDTGPLRTAVHLGGSMWLAGGADGLVAVDVALACVDQRVELPGVVSLASAPNAGRAAASDATGAIHVLELAELEHGTELHGYPDAVRHLEIAPGGDLVVAGADDEVTWWSISADGRVADEPECSVGHDTAITACAIGASGYVATGDADGMVRLWSPRLRDLPVGALPLGREVTALEWNSSGEHLAIGTAGGEFVVADIEAGELL